MQTGNIVLRIAAGRLLANLGDTNIINGEVLWWRWGVILLHLYLERLEKVLLDQHSSIKAFDPMLGSPAELVAWSFLDSAKR